MTERGESSRAREEDIRGFITDIITVSYDTIPGYQMPPISIDDTPEEQRGVFRDIPLDTIQPRMTETPADTETEMREDHVETDPDEEYMGRSSTPVRGGVTRFGGHTDSEIEAEEDDDSDRDGPDAGSDPEREDDETDMVPESDPEEDPEEAPLEEESVQHDQAGHVDGMGSTADDIIEGMAELQEQLEARVHDLEVQNQVHQDMEDQYRGIAYQRLHESIDLQRERQELIAQLEGEVTRSDHLQMERDAARAELQMVRGELALETAIGEAMQEGWTRASDRVTELEGQVRDTTARIDTALFTFDTAMGRLRSRVRRYPRDEDMTRRVIDRRVVDHMIYQEHRDAIRRVTRD